MKQSNGSCSDPSGLKTYHRCSIIMSKSKTRNLACDAGQDLVDIYNVPEVAARAAGEGALVQAQAGGGTQVQIRFLHPFTECIPG